jgi:anti-anti-sigma factor
MTDVEAEPLSEVLRPRGPVQFRLDERRQDGAAVITVRGELDLLTAPKLAARINPFVRRGSGDVVIDLRDAVFIDSTGLSIMLNLRRRLVRGGRRLTVVCDEGPVRRVIELARLEETLGVVSGLGI